MSHTRLRSDGRYEVADTLVGNAHYGCQQDTHCILANGHHGDCEEDRDVWAGPGEEYANETDGLTEKQYWSERMDQDDA